MTTTTSSAEPDRLAAIREAVVIAVLRAPSPDACLRATEALVAGGITGIEVTYSTPDAAAVIAELRARHGAAIRLGAGTVLTSQQAQAAVAAGAEFLVSPGTTSELAPAMLETGVTVMSGALTPSEVMTATGLGVHVVKLFPGALGGPAYLRALRGPFPEVAFVPTGGVTVDNLGDWLDAGALAVGAGGELASTEAMRRQDWPTLTAAAERFSAAARAAQVNDRG